MPKPKSAKQAGSDSGHSAPKSFIRGAQHAKDWAWSSFRHYATGAEGIVEIESEWTARRKERMGLAPKLPVQETPALAKKL